MRRISVLEDSIQCFPACGRQGRPSRRCRELWPGRLFPDVDWLGGFGASGSIAVDPAVDEQSGTRDWGVSLASWHVLSWLCCIWYRSMASLRDGPADCIILMAFLPSPHHHHPEEIPAPGAAEMASQNARTHAFWHQVAGSPLPWPANPRWCCQVQEHRKRLIPPRLRFWSVHVQPRNSDTIQSGPRTTRMPTHLVSPAGQSRSQRLVKGKASLRDSTAACALSSNAYHDMWNKRGRGSACFKPGLGKLTQGLAHVGGWAWPWSRASHCCEGKFSPRFRMQLVAAMLA